MKGVEVSMDELDPYEGRSEPGYYVGLEYGSHAPQFEAPELPNTSSVVDNAAGGSAADGSQRDVEAHGSSQSSYSPDQIREFTPATSITEYPIFLDEDFVSLHDGNKVSTHHGRPISVVYPEASTILTPGTPFICRHPVCAGKERSYRTQSALTKHEKNHMPKEHRPYGCKIHAERFLTPKDLRRHEKTHETRAEREHRCTACGSRLSRSDNLKRHKGSRKCIQ